MSDMVTVPGAVDWQKITLDIRHNYKSLSRVAKEVGSDWRHLHRLARGEVMDTKYKVGLRLLAIHKEYCSGASA